MEHVKSTLATTALLVMGLVTAAQLLHPRDPDEGLRRAKPHAAAVSDGATAWSDPPARPAQAAEARPARPASFTMLPAAMAASLPGVEAQVQPRRAQKAEPTRGRRLVQLGLRSRSASIAQGAGVERPAADGQPGKAAQGDPIGDLLKGLGIGSEG